MSKEMPCPKCRASSGDDWEQCKGSCPMPMSPHYTPAPEGEVVAWGCFDTNGLDDKLVYRDRRRAEDAAFAFTPSLTVKPLYASPVVPKTADEIKAVVMAWLDADDPASWGDFEKRLNAAVSDDASPVVPVGSGESERKLVGQDYINAIKAHRVEHGSSLAVARNAVDCGWRPPAPVVPVGVSREVIARIIDPVSWEALDVYGQDKAAFIGLTTDHSLAKADRIIAAIRPTDTGRE
jgi:hypothetical protein